MGCAQKYEKNLQKAQLTDSTIMLWNDRCTTFTLMASHKSLTST